MSDRVTAPQIMAMKAEGRRIVCVTAYDATAGKIADDSGVDLILVGDSLGNTVFGHSTTLPVTLDQVIHHTQATRNGVERALLVADLPFGSYQVSPEQAVESSIALVKAGADAVKLEGAYSEAISSIRKAGIPVMGHVGMTPQSVNAFGGFRVQGKGKDGELVLQAARQVDEAGAFAIVLELIPATLAKTVTSSVSCATIGIGAGPDCDGEIQVFHDVVGLSARVFRHSKRYTNSRLAQTRALRRYTQEVREREFPGKEQSF